MTKILFGQISIKAFAFIWTKYLLSKPQLNLNYSWVQENECANPTTPPIPPSTETQWYHLGDSDEHLFTTTRYDVISNNK